MDPRGGIDELSRNPHAIRSFANAAFQDVEYPSSRPSCFTSTSRPLYVKLELRAITTRALNRESAVMMSSAMPSAKYSCSGSPPMFWKGSSAMEGLSGSASGTEAFLATTAARHATTENTRTGSSMFLTSFARRDQRMQTVELFSPDRTRRLTDRRHPH
jgi:hypothetical protein